MAHRNRVSTQFLECVCVCVVLCCAYIPFSRGIGIGRASEMVVAARIGKCVSSFFRATSQGRQVAHARILIQCLHVTKASTS